MLTPSTKAEYGKHDEPISEAEILRQKLVEPAVWEEARQVALRLFGRGQEWAASRGLILVDTKYEMGTIAEENGPAGRGTGAGAEPSKGKLVVIDEIHTPDSSRYWIAEGSEERFQRGEDQRMLDKENIRQWLIKTHGFSGQGKPPPLTDEVRISLARTYVNLYELLTGETFRAEVGSVEERIKRNLAAKGYLK